MIVYSITESLATYKILKPSSLFCSFNREKKEGEEEDSMKSETLFS